MDLGVLVLTVDDLFYHALLFDLDATFLDDFLHEVRDNVVIHLNFHGVLDNAWFFSISCLDFLVEDETPEINVRVLNCYGGLFLIVNFPNLFWTKVLDVREEILIVKFQFLNHQILWRILWQSVFFWHERLKL